MGTTPAQKAERARRGKKGRRRNPPKRRTVSRAGYQAYIHSDAWGRVKLRYRSSGLPQTCYGCGDASKAVELHHRTYKRLGNENLTDLIPLCRTCHAAAHRIARTSTPAGSHPGTYEYKLYSAARKVRRANGVRGDAWDRRPPNNRRVIRDGKSISLAGTEGSSRRRGPR